VSVQVSYKKQIAFGIVFLICILGVLEISARTFYFWFGDCNSANVETMNYDYFLKKQICYDQQTLAYDEQPVLTIIPNQHFATININNDGFRGNEIDSINEFDSFRIMMIGGSALFGAGMSMDDETIPNQLNKIIHETHSNVEVINAGIPGITSFQELYHIKNKLINFNPDMIIIYDGANDVTYKMITDPVILTDDDKKSQLKDFQVYFKAPVIFYRYVVYPIINLQSSVESTNIFISPNKQYDDEVSRQIAFLWEKRMTEFCKISNEKNIQSIVIIQPTLAHGKKELSNFEKTLWTKNIHFEKTFDYLIQKSENLTDCTMVRNFSDIFENVDDGIYFDNVHLNNEGNKIVANKIYNEIKDLLSHS